MYHYIEAGFNIEQIVAQGELETYIQAPAHAIAPEPEIQFIGSDGYNYKARVANQVIATIAHDSSDFVNQPWVVMVGEIEVHRANTWAKCASYIRWHYKQRTLFLGQQAMASIDELLDKPFDELTHEEWETLRQYEPQELELIAA